MNFVSKIIISSDFEGITKEMLEKFNSNDLRFIPKNVTNEFLIEDAKAVEKESYIAESTQKIIIIMAHSYRNEAQNFLLKLFEEPPKNIKFLIVCPSKNLLLPTVRSRFMVEIRKEKKQRKDLNLNLKKLDFKEIFNFLQNHENLEKNELMDLIATLSLQSIKELSLNEKELEFFYKAYELAKLNGRASILFSALLLNLEGLEK